MAGWDVVPSAKTVAHATGLGLLTASALVAVQVISGLVISNCYSAVGVSENVYPKTIVS
jgi:hypothetical protein